MSRAFDYCASMVLSEEGGLVDDHRDPGGRTNLGITQGTLDNARMQLTGLPARVDTLTRAQALRIYEQLYWRPVRGDELPLPIAMLTFDSAVNQGVGAATRFLQTALGVNADGAIGPRTLAAAHARPILEAIAELAARRMHAYMLLDRLDDTFGLGWSRRLVRATLAAQRAIGVSP